MAMMDKKIKEMSGKKDLEDMNLEELDELEDEEDERILMEYRNQRLAEMKALQERSKYGEVKEITAPEYVKEVSERRVTFHEFPYLLTYMAVFDLVQARAACADGFSDHCIFVSPLLQKRKVLRQAFFDTCLPLGVGVQNVKRVKQK